MKSRKIILGVLLAGSMGVCFVGRAPAASTGSISDAEALSGFTAAAAAYRAEDYDKAAAAYEEVLRGGKESGALYYNLGNSYFKKGSLGKAVLNYERARRLVPRDGDLNFNLEYARAKANLPTVSGMSWAQLAPTPNKDGVGVPTSTQLSVGIEPASSKSWILTGEVSPRLWRGGQRIRKVGPDVPLPAQVGGRIRNWTDRELAWALCALALLLAAAHVSSLYGRWPRRSRRGVLGSLCVLWLVCAGGLVTKFSAEKDLAVAVAAGEAKFEPREDATAHFRVPEGTRAKVLRVEGPWAKIRRGDGKTGWVPEKVFGRF